MNQTEAITVTTIIMVATMAIKDGGIANAMWVDYEGQHTYTYIP